MIKDRFGRPVVNLRVSVTQRCNLHCPYCHREGQEKTVENSTVEMTPEEIARIVKQALGLGMNKVKLTGGEPLVREDINQIVKTLSQLKGIRDLSMTTNGVLLADYAWKLKDSGLMRVNVNLPSLDSGTYESLTGGSLEDVLEGIDVATHVGFHPVKLNMLVLKGVNRNEIPEMVSFAEEKGVILQLIELEPINVSQTYYENHHEPLDDVESDLRKQAQKIVTRSSMQNRRIYSLQGVKVEVIRPIENTEFCLHCPRMRITSDGELKPCLMRNDNLTDLLAPLRKGASDAELKALFLDAVNKREPYYKPCQLSISG